MEKILLAIDCSAHSLRVAEYAAHLARCAPSGVLHVLYVEEAVPLRSHAYLSQDEINKMYQEEGAARCGEALGYLRTENIPFQWHVAAGDPAEQIAKLATTLGVDTIVIGSHGMGQVSSLVMGSVANKVVHEAKVPVTIVK